MKRRDFIKGATIGAGALASGMLPAKGLAGTSSTPGNTFGKRKRGVGFKKIDAFCHFAPISFLNYLPTLGAPLRGDLMAYGSAVPEHSDIASAQNGGWNSSGFPVDPTAAFAPRLKMMEDMGIDVSIIFPQPDLEGGLATAFNPANAALAAQFINNYMSNMSVFSSQFKFAALLPMTDVNTMTAEFNRALTMPGVVGFAINTGPLTTPPDDLGYSANPVHLALYQLAADNNVPVWIHLNRAATYPDYTKDVAVTPPPPAPPVPAQFSYDYIWVTFGFLMDGSADMMRLAALSNPDPSGKNGVFNVYPGLKLIVHQRGHLIPFYKDRIRMHFEAFNNIFFPPVGQLPIGSGPGSFDLDNFMDQLSQFYVDAISSGQDTDLLTRSIDFFGADHVMFATDAAYSPNGGRWEAESTTNSVLGLQVPNKVLRGIFAGNVEAVINQKLV